MAAPKLPPLQLFPLSSRSLRDIFNAPELERLLAQSGADMSAMDQFEAVKVRVRKGVEVVSDRIRAGTAAAKRRAVWFQVAISTVAGALAALWILSRKSSTLALLACLSFGFLAIVSLSGVRKLRRDLRTLRSLAHRYNEAVEGSTEMNKLLDLSRSIFDEVSVVGGKSRDRQA